jgi:hypothetical protein
MRTTVLAAAFLAATALLLGACGDKDTAAPADSVASTRPARASVSTVTVTETRPKTRPKPKLEDGRHFGGYIKSVDMDASPATVSFDLAFLLTGDEANAEAEKRGYPTPVDNDYFIVNDNPKLRLLPLADDIEVRLLDWKHCCDFFFDGDLERFAGSFEKTEYPAGNYKGAFSAYELTVEEGAVARIDEHFFP